MKKLNILVILFLILKVNSNVLSITNESFKPKNDYIFCISIPKTGTHLLIKCLTLFKIPEIYFAFERDYDHYGTLDKLLNTEEFIQKTTVKSAVDFSLTQIKKRILEGNDPLHISHNVHLVYNKKSHKFIDTHSKKNFLMVRDPRDQIASFAYYIYKVLPESLNISYNAILMDLIKGEQTCQMPLNIPLKHLHALCTTIGLVKFYKVFLRWSKNPKFLVIKFENLVGAKGGGTQELQIKEIKKIGQHLGLKLNQNAIDSIIENLYGGTWTFREGKTGNWRNYFTHKHIEAFKNMPGANELLIKLGYEKDFNW